MNKTYKELIEADQLMAQLYSKNPQIEQGKLGYAWGRFIKKNYNPISIELNDKISDNRVAFALIDPTTKELLYADANQTKFKYSKEGMQSLIEANRVLVKQYEEREIEIIPFIVKPEDIPELSEGEKETFKDLVI